MTTQAEQSKQTGNSSNVKRTQKNEIQKTENGQITPIELLDRAIEQNLDIEKLEKLMALQIRYEDRQAQKAYVEAMALFRSEIPDIKKTKQGHNSKYAPLYQIVDAIKDIEQKHGLTHIWKTEQDKGIKVICRVTHIGGHYEETSMIAEADKSGSKNDIQAIGSTISYLERYTLCALYGIATQDMDNDGDSGPKQPKSQNALIEAKIKESWEVFEVEAKLNHPDLNINYEKFKAALREQYKKLSEVKREEFQWTRPNIDELAAKIDPKDIAE